MKSKNKKQVKMCSKLAVYFFAFTLILLAILWVCQTVFLEDIYKVYKTSSVRQQAQNIATCVGKTTLEEDVKLYSEKYDFTIIVIEKTGKILARSSSSDYSYLMTLSREHFKERYDSFDKTDIEYLDNEYIVQTPEGITKIVEENQKLVYTAKYTVGEIECAVFIESDIAPVAATVEALKFELVIITIVVIILAVLMVVFMSEKLSKPIIKTNEIAKKLADGEFPKDFENKGYQEIAELNETLKYASNELERVDKLSNEIIANVSHDLRTPLTMISGYAEAMRDIPGESSPENLQIIIDESDRLKNLVNQLLFLSKLRSGSNKLQKERFSITDATKSIVARINKMIEQDGYKVTFANIENAKVFADRERIEQVIYNLVANAIAYTGADGQVLVRQTVLNDGGVKLEIIDSGKGIEADMIPYVWKRYYKNPYAKTHYKGVGVGLSIVKGILDLHEAEYGIISEVGKGSNFWFIIRD